MWTQRLDKLLLFATFLSTSTCEPCTPEFQPNFNDVVQLTYAYKSGMVNKMVVKMANGESFTEMFTESCRDLSKIRVDYRKVEDSDWTKFVGRRGIISLDRGKTEIRQSILPCAEYQVKIVGILEDQTEIDSEIISFGPFYKEMDEDTIKEKLTDESMPDISDTITYSNINSTGFTVSWGDICAQSLNFYLLKGPKFDDYGSGAYKTITNVLESNSGNSLWISTEPCQQYKVAIESFMTKQPITDDGYDGSRDHKNLDDFTTDPLPDTLITTAMEEGSNVLTWEFTDQQDCVADINYEIDLISESGEDTNSLLAGNWEDEATEVDISENTYSPCENYDLQMKISYTTKSGNSKEKSVFRRSFRTNHLGEFAPEGTNHLSILEDTVSVTFETCDIEAVVALVDENEDSTVQEFTVTHADVNVELEEINELMRPCVHYNVQLRGRDGEEFNSEPLEPKKPQGKVAFNHTEYSTKTLEFSVNDIEENSRCQVSGYQVTCHSQEDNEEGSGDVHEFVGNSFDGSFVEVSNLAPITIYNCNAIINYTGYEDNTDVIAADGGYFVTEGFDTIEIVDGNIVVTCESRVKNLQMALVHPDETKTRVKILDANCTGEQPIDIFKESTQPCVNYTLELFEKPENIDVFDISSSASDLVVFDKTEFPVKAPEHRLDMDLLDLQSEGGSLKFKIEDYVQNQFCQIKSRSVTCMSANSTGDADETEEDHFDELDAEETTIQIDGLTRGRFYVCHAEVDYVVPEHEEPLQIVYSEPHVFETEGFDSFYFIDDNSIQVICGSNLKQLKLVLIESNGTRIAVKDAICEGSDDIEDFRTQTKPCGKYKLELISAQEYDNILTMERGGHQKDIHSVAIQELSLQVQKPEGQPELNLTKTGIDNAEFQVVDEINELCEVNVTEIFCSSLEAESALGNQSYVDVGGKCEGNSTDCNNEEADDALEQPDVNNGYGKSFNQSYIKVADLTADTKYNCFANIIYSVPGALENEEGSRDIDSDDTNQGDNWISENVSLRTNDVPVGTLPVAKETTVAPAIKVDTIPIVESIPIVETKSLPSSSDNTPAITGAVVGVAIVLIIVTVAVVLKRKRSVNNNNLKEKDPATVKIDLAENKVTVEDNTDKENNITNCEKEDEVIIKNGAANDVHVDMEIENVLKEKESIEDGLKESSL